MAAVTRTIFLDERGLDEQISDAEQGEIGAGEEEMRSCAAGFSLIQRDEHLHKEDGMEITHTLKSVGKSMRHNRPPDEKHS